jgi:purine-binding chemotaxis protein CheW
MSDSIAAANLNYKDLMQRQHANGSFVSVGNQANKKSHEYDFKIVSFMLGQQYYAIDIMAVKEIINASRFTRIPNALDFVMGVLNIRGEIIPIINLAKMFHLNSEITAAAEQQIIVIKIDTLSIGLVVDKISQVISLRKSDIQPPSPLLGGINERYIAGVAEISSRLYVILDIEYIFSDKEKPKMSTLPQDTDLNEEFFTFFCNQTEELAGVHINDYNKAAFTKIYIDYAKETNLTQMPKLDGATAQNMISRFVSQYTGELWDKPYTDYFTDTVIRHLTTFCSDEIRVLNVGCGNGYEAYTLYALLCDQIHGASVRMLAADSNLSAVSAATNFELSGRQIPSWVNKEKYFVRLGENSYKIKREVTDQIYFEFHNAANIASYNREFDLVVARDLSLSMSADDYKAFLEGVSSKIVSGGVLLLGDNEHVAELKGFDKIENNHMVIYKKK